MPECMLYKYPALNLDLNVPGRNVAAFADQCILGDFW